MPLSPGDKLGAYEILGPLGKGGMGEVYRARDGQLNREVAIKVLPAALADDAHYRDQFTREAQSLAALNHPNIATIYGLEGNAIVMELVEGESPRGPMQVIEALSVARQIAEALEAAHDKGIVHRDLKPGNVKVTPEGAVKVLDFGLAQTPEKASEAAPGADSLTLTMRATLAGVIVGTPAYMSPEQASGKMVDRRADIWSFGVVLYQLLTGELLFKGATVSDTLADVLRKEIDLGKLPSETPPAIRELLRRCLDRNLKNRLQHIGEARVAIDLAGTEPAAALVAARPPWPWIAVAALFAAIAAVLAFVHSQQRPQELPLRTFSFTPKNISTNTNNRRAAISPDGRHIVYVAENKLWVRALDSEQARAIEGSEGAEGPFWSPDSAQIGFAACNELKKAALSGGGVFALAKLTSSFRGGSWSPDGRTMLVSGATQGLVEFPAKGGSGQLVAPTSRRYVSPTYLPFTGKNQRAIASIGNLSGQTLELVDLETGRAETLHVPGAFPVWSPAGYILYQTDGRTPGLQALRFSPETGKAEAQPVPLRNGGSDFSVSAEGTLLWMDPLTVRQLRLTWRDRNGSKLNDTGVPPSRNISQVRLSPDGTKAVYRAEEGNVDIWVADLTRGVSSRLTFGPEQNDWPFLSPSGQEIVFSRWGPQNSTADIYVAAASGAGETRPVVVSPDPNFTQAWSPDGTTLLFRRFAPKTGFDLWTVKRKADGTFEPPGVWLQTPFNESYAAYSPDGHYVTYQSDESGRNEIYVRPAAGGRDKWQISNASGFAARWSRDGREIFYTQGDRLMAAPVSDVGGTLQPGTPVELFRNPAFVESALRAWDAHPDGKRFLLAEPDEDGLQRSSSIHVIQNWPALLGEKAKH
jgi:Tol biopolymer transport system component